MILTYEFNDVPSIASVDQERDYNPRIGETVYHRGVAYKVIDVIYSTTNLIVRVILSNTDNILYF